MSSRREREGGWSVPWGPEKGKALREVSRRVGELEKEPGRGRITRERGVVVMKRRFERESSFQC